ncbi:MAG: hypothetical protein OXG36_01925 [Caldilineaceae bacterium]|nr:hypothetical protein [Caldilineaceae bacterium]
MTDSPKIPDIEAQRSVFPQAHEAQEFDDYDQKVREEQSRGTIRNIQWINWMGLAVLVIMLLIAVGAIIVLAWHLFGPEEKLWLKGDRYARAVETALVGALPIVFIFLQRLIDQSTKPPG